MGKSISEFLKDVSFFDSDLLNNNGMYLPASGLVLLAGRPGVGKSYAGVELVNEMNKKGIKSLLIYADGGTSHDIIRYDNGKAHTYPSVVSRVKSVYPDIPYVIEDCGRWFSPYEWDVFLTDCIDHEKPKALFINSICFPREKAATELLQTFHRVAENKKVLIIAEINVSGSVEKRKNKHPKPKDVRCARRAHKFVENYIFVYRDVRFEADGKEKSGSLEVYTLNGEKAVLLFNPEKYAAGNTNPEGNNCIS